MEASIERTSEDGECFILLEKGAETMVLTSEAIETLAWEYEAAWDLLSNC